MRIVLDTTGEHADVINSNYDLEGYHDDSEEDVLFIGYHSTQNEEVKEEYKDYKKRSYLNLEAPTAFASTTTCMEEQDYFTHVYTLCPYVCEYANSREGNTTEYIPMPFPFPGEMFKSLDTDTKDIDSMFMGTLMCADRFRIIDAMRPYKYVHCSLFHYQFPYTPTHVGIPFTEKIALLARSRACVVMNICSVERDPQRDYIRNNKDWDKIEAFNDLECGYIPQIKPGVFEAMAAKSIVLVKKDPWNVIERYFTEDKHFLYWDTFEELKNIIGEIKSDPEKFQHIVDNAYDRVYCFDFKSAMGLIKGEVNELLVR